MNGIKVNTGGCELYHVGRGCSGGSVATRNVCPIKGERIRDGVWGMAIKSKVFKGDDTNNGATKEEQESTATGTTES